MKAAILSINIGEYICFWKEFYLSCQENFMTDMEKSYYVFTDSECVYGKEQDDIKVIYQRDLGWPNNTMKRFHMFLSVLEELAEYDYVFFLNANTLVKKKLNSKLLNPEKSIITVEHPGKHGKPVARIPWERRPESNAYVPLDRGKIYVQGSFIGGKSKSFIELVKELDRLTEDDLQKGIIAVWHDESFLNKYIIGRNDVQILGWQYTYHEGTVRPYEPVLMLRDKKKYISRTNGRFVNRRGIRLSIKSVLRNIKWWLLIRIHIYKRVRYIDKKGNYLDTDLSLRIVL